MITNEAQSDLAVIKKIMEDSRKINIDNGKHYLFWGVLVTFALLCNYILLLTKSSSNYIGLTWFILMLTGGIVDVLIKRRENKTRKVHTYAGNILGSLWLSSGIAMFIFGFLGTVSGAYNSIFICPIISTSLGISYFTSGAIQQIKWFQYLAFGWWTGAALMFIYPSIHTLLIYAVMVICLQIIPGIILNNKSKKFLESETKGLNA